MAYKWTDNPTESGKSNCNTDVLNECLMHLKYDLLDRLQDTGVTIKSFFEALYPVGSIYLGTMNTCPLIALDIGTWQLVAQDRVLQGSGSKTAGSTVEAGLPNITGDVGSGETYYGTGAFYQNGDTSGSTAVGGAIDSKIGFDASRSNSIYGKSNTVQPPAYVVNIWKRIS
jgi:hypothetical protein